MGTDTIALAGALVETGNMDTVYRDVYLERARTLLSSRVSLEDFHHLEQQRKGLAGLPAVRGRTRAAGGELAAGQGTEPAHDILAGGG